MGEFAKLILGWFGRPRNLQVLALIMAAPAVTITTLIYLWAVLTYKWDGPEAALQLEIIRDGVMYMHLLLFLIIAALTAGLIRSVELRAGKAEFAVDLMDDFDGTAVAKTGMMFGAENADELRDYAEVPPSSDGEYYDDNHDGRSRPDWGSNGDSGHQHSDHHSGQMGPPDFNRGR